MVSAQACIKTVAQSAASARRPTEYWASSREKLTMKQKITSHCYENPGAATSQERKGCPCNSQVQIKKNPIETTKR